MFDVVSWKFSAYCCGAAFASYKWPQSSWNGSSAQEEGCVNGTTNASKQPIAISLSEESVQESAVPHARPTGQAQPRSKVGKGKIEVHRFYGNAILFCKNSRMQWQFLGLSDPWAFFGWLDLKNVDSLHLLKTLAYYWLLQNHTQIWLMAIPRP